MDDAQMPEPLRRAIHQLVSETWTSMQFRCGQRVADEAQQPEDDPQIRR